MQRSMQQQAGGTAAAVPRGGGPRRAGAAALATAGRAVPAAAGATTKLLLLLLLLMQRLLLLLQLGFPLAFSVTLAAACCLLMFGAVRLVSCWIDADAAKTHCMLCVVGDFRRFSFLRPTLSS